MTFFQKVKTKTKYLYKKYGWKALVGIFMYYLVRDVTLYIIIPYIAFSKMQN